VCANGGQRWIVDANTFREINSAGLDIGWDVREWMDNYPYDRPDAPGGTIVRNNIFHACGTAGIRSMVVVSSLVEHNHLYDIGWWRAEATWETAGIKLLISSGTLVRYNVIHDMIQAQAIWMDWEHENSRVTRNACFDIVANVHGAILVEGTVEPVWIDHNFVWNVTGNGIVQVDGSHMVVAHNFVGQTSKPGFNCWSNAGRQGDGNYNTVSNNVFYNTTVAFNGLPPNTSDYNVFFGWGRPSNGDHDLNSVSVTGAVSCAPDVEARELNLTWSCNTSIPLFPPYNGISSRDYFYEERASGNVASGLIEYPSSSAESVNLWPGQRLPVGAGLLPSGTAVAVPVRPAAWRPVTLDGRLARTAWFAGTIAAAGTKTAQLIRFPARSCGSHR